MSYKEKPQIKLYKYENSAFVLQAIIDDYAECSFENNRFQAGQFSITINYNIPNALLFERGLFIQFSNNPYAFGEIVNITDSIGADGKGSQIRIITGYDARYIFKRRIIKNLNDVDSWSMTAKGEICMRNLIQDQCGSNAETKRQLPITNVIPDPTDAIGSEYSVSESFTNLYEVLTTIATQTEIGWRLNFNGSALSLEFYEGTDRHLTVRFDTDFESLSNGEFTDSSESFANSIYVCGKGEGEERDMYEGESAIEGSSPSGLERYEAYDNQSAMTTESEYEAEALAMLSQYSQTLQVSGKGLAKCPYEYGKEYDVGDIITVAFSGKSAVVQILSVTEHWTWGNYNLEFTFGKPQPDLNKQLQLILKQIQKASSKTTATASVKWYTVTNTASMQSGEVIYDTLGFTGNVGTGKTFTLYLDDEKTGSKNYNIYIRNLTGTGKLTLTTGKTGATDIQLATGDYVGRIFVDENGNIIIESLTATSTIESGSNQPATSGAVADAIASIDTSHAETADKLTTARNLKVALDSADAQSFDGSANAESIGVSGILPVANGGTGQTDLANVNVGSATSSGRVSATNITIKTGTTAQAKISLNTLMAWLMHNDRKYIPSGVNCYRIITTSWAYSDNDILQLSANGVNYELQLAGVVIEFLGNATNYNTGMFRLRIHSSPTTSFTVTSGYTVFPVSRIAEYTCNGSSYTPIWKIVGTDEKFGNNHWGLTAPDGADNVWIRTTSQGLLPYQGGYAGDGHNYLGTSSWYFKYGYIDEIYGHLNGYANQADYTRGTAVCTTDGATQAKVASMRGYVLQEGATFPITFTKANTYNGKITLNVNSTGAKDIYINNDITSSSNKTLPAGTYLCKYNGANYYIELTYCVTTSRYAYNSDYAGVANKIRTSAPSSPANGDIWIE